MTGILDALVEMNVAAAAAIAFLLLVRKPARLAFGAHAVYLLWAAVPIALLATFIPSRTIETLTLGLTLEEVIALTTGPVAASMLEAALPTALVAIWIGGAVWMFATLIRRQAEFLRDADLGVAGPAIVGFSQPRIVTPDDFVRRFSLAERKLILTHEQVHLDRSDARINAIVALARCLFWFNPLVHMGAKAMRVDQELSCDAEVLDRRPRVRRAYAETLLKTQLVSRPLPVGCYWPADSQHPLTARIDMLARKPVSGRRRAAATAIALALTASAGVAAWAAQPERTIITEAPDILVPFQPVPPDGQLAEDSTRPTLIPQTAVFAKAWPLPHRVSKAEVTAELCISSGGAVENVTLVKSSGYEKVDAIALGAIHAMKFKPATHKGAPVGVCNHGFTIAYDAASSASVRAPP